MATRWLWDARVLSGAVLLSFGSIVGGVEPAPQDGSLGEDGAEGIAGSTQGTGAAKVAADFTANLIGQLEAKEAENHGLRTQIDSIGSELDALRHQLEELHRDIGGVAFDPQAPLAGLRDLCTNQSKHATSDPVPATVEEAVTASGADPGTDSNAGLAASGESGSEVGADLADLSRLARAALSAEPCSVTQVEEDHAGGRIKVTGIAPNAQLDRIRRRVAGAIDGVRFDFEVWTLPDSLCAAELQDGWGLAFIPKSGDRVPQDPSLRDKDFGFSLDRFLPSSADDCASATKALWGAEVRIGLRLSTLGAAEMWALAGFKGSRAICRLESWDSDRSWSVRRPDRGRDAFVVLNVSGR